MSPMKLVGCDALSTAFSPFTPVAPPDDVLMLSQPGPSGWQLTEGSAKPALAAAIGAWVPANGAWRWRDSGLAARAG